MHTCVLFVDDEPLILSLYESLTPELGPEFSVKTANNGHDALRVLDENDVQIVVSDLEMPEMNGGELLTRVEKRFPNAMRVVISGYDDELHVARCLTFGHRYLRKPIHPETLADTLKRLSTLKRSLESEHFKALLASPDALPSPPEIYLRLSEALQASENSVDEFAAIIEDDATLSAQLLEVVNSGAFRLSVDIESVKELFEVVGVHVVRALILALHTKAFFEPRTSNSGLFQRLWAHSIHTASLARKLASIDKLHFRDAQTCFVAGLLHDIGKFVIAARATREDSERWADPDSLREYEREILKVSHANIGAYLLGLWGLPESIVVTAELHHSLERVPPTAYSPTLYVHAAQTLGVPERRNELDLDFLKRAGKADRVTAWVEALNQYR